MSVRTGMAEVLGCSQLLDSKAMECYLHFAGTKTGVGTLDVPGQNISSIKLFPDTICDETLQK